MGLSGRQGRSIASCTLSFAHIFIVLFITLYTGSVVHDIINLHMSIFGEVSQAVVWLSEILQVPPGIPPPTLVDIYCGMVSLHRRDLP